MKTQLFIFVWLILAIPCQAKTITVDDDGPADFNNIQEAINDSNDGDIIIVNPGTYTGDGNRDIDFDGKAITVRSMDPNDPDIVTATIIDCNGTEDEPHRGFFFHNAEDENSILDGFTITGGYVSGNIMAIYPPFDGGSIYCTSSSPTIRNCIIRGNRAWWNGGGIFVWWEAGSTISHITNCTITENYAGNKGGGIWTDDYLIIANSIITDNTSGVDGGGIQSDFPGLDIINSTVIGNSAGDSGGGICADGGWNGLFYNISNCIFWGNVDLEGCEIALKNDNGGTPAELDISYSDIEGGIDGVCAEEDCIVNWGEGNINTDPMFVDAYNPDPNERNYHLLASSPCINAGDPNGNYVGQNDMDGQPRVMVLLVDIGADEFHPGIHNITLHTYYFTIQDAIDEAQNGDTTIIEDGTYIGQGNRDINFLGKAIMLRSRNGPDNCIINCEQLGTGFIFNYGEDPNSVVDGFTITNGFSLDVGGGILCESSSPTIKNCIISDNSPDGIWMDGMSNAWIAGTVQIISNNLTGNGTLQVLSNATLEIHDSGISCDAVGIGTVLVPAGKELIIENEAVVDLGDLYDPNTRGTIQCDGLLRVTDNAEVSNANINTALASFEGSAVISENVITTRAETPYGQIAVKDSALIIENVFHANGDRYIDVNPSAFAGVIQDNQVFVTVSEGRNDTPPGLFELRGQDMFCLEPPCEPNLYPLEPIPDFDVNTWTIERFEVLDGAKVTFTNRFDFQPPYDSDPNEEVLYVRHLIIGPNSVCNIGINRIYYETLEGDPNDINDIIMDKPPMGFLLDEITLDSEEEFETQIANDNVYDEYPMIFVERVEGLEPDPCGVMRMSIQVDLDPCSSNYLKVFNARAKGLFARSSEDQILIRFKYLFETPDPNAGLVVYLSDVPDLLAYDDPNWMEHYIEIAYLPAPPQGRPGSAASGRFGVFHMTVSTEDLDFTEGMWVEIELIGPAGSQSPATGDIGSETSDDDTSILIDDWGVEVHCDGICMDVNWDTIVSEGDFLTVIAACGLPASLDPNATDSLVCLDGFFSGDGFVDTLDVISWDWAVDSGDSFLYYCGVPLGEAAATGATGIGEVIASAGSSPYVSLPDSLGDLLIAGKRSTSGDYFELKSKDRLFVFDNNGVCEGWSAHESDRCNIRLVQDLEGNLYQLNSGEGLLRLDDTNDVIIPPGEITGVNEPRYNKATVVYVGLKGSGQDAVGRPIFDAAFDDSYVYVVPVIVDPNDPNEEPYTAAAKLLLLESGDPPYQLMQLYDDPPLPGDNQYRNNLREIELDAAGNVYVVNVHSLNESDTLFKYDPNGTKIKSLSLGNPGTVDYLPDPIGMHVSDITGMLYVASGQYNPADINSTVVHGLSLEDLSLKRSITVNGMHHVSGITEEPATGALWIVGFNMDSFPQWPDPTQSPFYRPCLAKVPYDDNLVQAESIYDPVTHDLALPISIIWTKPVKCGGADIDGDGKVTFADMAVIGLAWLTEIGDSDWNSAGNISIPADAFIDNRDLTVLVEHWLETGCL